MTDQSPLPIDAALPALTQALRAASRAVLVAPPGAGKTTRVPLVLLQEPWAQETGRIVLLEPRRLAARGAAARMAQSLGEAVGDTVGLRVRLGSKISKRTRIEVVTDGVFLRMILKEPDLPGVVGVIFDEYHERSLDADLSLALALDAQAGLRPDLRLLVMSATLDGARVAGLLDRNSGAGETTAVVESAGRAFPVETRYLGRDPNKRIEDQVLGAIQRALRQDEGSILVFLPGQGEITRLAQALIEARPGPDILVAPLYGALDQRAQDAAVAPTPPGKRKVVLTTAIAETSLTIEGVRIVIDSGLARVPRFEPGLGLTRLETVWVSRAAADQRRGRAGRTQPGICYRLWEEAATGSLQAFATPEILNADLASLVLDCAVWGVNDPTSLPFLDPPPAAALAEAGRLLRDLDAIDADGRLSALGRHLHELPLPPRLARMLIAAARHGQAQTAAEIAAILAERGLGGDAIDLDERLERFRRDRSPRGQEMRRLADGWAQQSYKAATLMALERSDSQEWPSAALLALAYPDRIAKARGKPGEFVMANGRGGAMPAYEHLAKSPFLVVAETTGAAASSRILLAAALSLEDVQTHFGDRIVESDAIMFERGAKALRARRLRRLGAIIFDEQPIPVPQTAETAVVFAQGLGELGIDALPWSKAQRQTIDRLRFLHAAASNDWPDLSAGQLKADVSEWLAPLLIGKSAYGEIDADLLQQALDQMIPWSVRSRLDTAMPSHFEAPTGQRHPIDYSQGTEPILAIRVQELFGLEKHPCIGGGTIPLVLHLLSPAQRPIQITRDLPGFWRGSWAAVKSEMRGRYPRHAWPDDPAKAMPTTRAKPRGT